MVLATLLLVSASFAVIKAPPDLSGTWKINRSKSTGASCLKAPTVVVITQSEDEIKFNYFSGETLAGSEIFLADGTERDRYSTRIERAYARTRWGKNSLVITTRHFLDALGYQSFAETDRWLVSEEKKTLTNELSDGTVVVYERQAPTASDPQ